MFFHCGLSDDISVSLLSRFPEVLLSEKAEEDVEQMARENCSRLAPGFRPVAPPLASISRSWPMWLRRRTVSSSTATLSAKMAASVRIPPYRPRTAGGDRLKLINIGFGSLVSARRLVAVVSPESAPIKRMVQEARERGRYSSAG